MAILQAALPATLESSAVASSSLQELEISPMAVDTALTEVKTRLFSPGPTDFMYSMKSVDDRLTSLADAITQCKDTAVQAYNPPAVVAGMPTFYFACKQEIDATSLGVSDFKVYFGKNGGFWYIGVFQTNSTYTSGGSQPPTLGTLAKIDEAGNTLDIYQVFVQLISSTAHASVLHIVADKSTGIFEVSTAATVDASQVSTGGLYTGLGCGVSMKTNSTLVYAVGMFSQMSSCGSSATVCASGTDLSTTTGCTGAITTFSLTNLARADISATNAKAMVVDRTGMPTF